MYGNLYLATWRLDLAAQSALARPGCLDLASTGSIWLPLAPLLGPSGLECLDLPAPGTLAGSIWLLCAVLGDPLARFGCPTSAPSTRLAKKNRFAYRRSCFDAACFVRSDTFLHASNLVCYRISCETPLDCCPRSTYQGHLSTWSVQPRKLTRFTCLKMNH